MENLAFRRDELIGIIASIAVACLFFVGLRYDLFSGLFPQSKSEISPADSGPIVIDEKNAAASLSAGMTATGRVDRLIIQDVRPGVGQEAKAGSRVVVNYVGMLPDGTQFDNSYDRGEPYAFTLGMKDVISGWDQGIMGMKVGGERILIIPAEMAYGDRAVGVIPRNSTLLFSVELISVE